jgi:hypothetical protein
MGAPIPVSIPPEVDAAVRAVVARDAPGRKISRIRLCESSSSALVVRVFLPVPRFRPTPYLIYRVDLAETVARQLSGSEAAPYLIPNYK